MTLSMNTLVWILCYSTSISCISDEHRTSTSKPNIIILYVEHAVEMQKALRGFKTKQMDTDHDTNTEDHHTPSLPHIRALLGDSSQFTRAYGEMTTASNVASILTGLPPIDVGITRGKILQLTEFPSIASSGGMRPTDDELPRKLGGVGYYSAFIGYWKLGLGPYGDWYPTKHGFDFWAGTVFHHSPSCKHGGSSSSQMSLMSNPKNTYLKLFYRTMFISVPLLVLLSSVLLLRFMTTRHYLSVVVYVCGSSFAFYVTVRLFLAQRSASCAYFVNDTIYEQPYEARNVTLRFTAHALHVLETHNFTATPLFLNVNYLKMKPPHFHSDYLRSDSSSDDQSANSRDTWSNSLLELDWSIGKIVSSLKKHEQYNNSVIILTGSNGCDSKERGVDYKISAAIKKLGLSVGCAIESNSFSTIAAFKRIEDGKFEIEKVLRSTDWEDQLKVPLFIKDVVQTDSPISTASATADTADTASTGIPSLQMISTHVPLTDLYATILHIADVPRNVSRQASTSVSFLPLFRSVVRMKLKDPLLEEFAFEHMHEILRRNATRHRGGEMDGHDDRVEHDKHDVLSALLSRDKYSQIRQFGAHEPDYPFFYLLSVQTYTPRTYMFHYYNVWRPVAVTYRGIYRQVYNTISDSGSLVKLDKPLFFPLPSNREVNKSENILPDQLELVHENISNALKEHLLDRRNKNLWSSEFEMPTYPWLLPCANIPRCEKIVRDEDLSLLHPMPSKQVRYGHIYDELIRRSNIWKSRIKDISNTFSTLQSEKDAIPETSEYRTASDVVDRQEL